MIKVMKVPFKFSLVNLFIPAFLASIYGVETGLLLVLLFMISIIFHECGHILMAQFLDVEIKEVNQSALLGSIQISECSSFKKSLIYFAGPVSSIILCIFSYLLWPLTQAPWTMYLFMISGLLAFINLIPLYPLDGANILNSMLENYKNGKLISFIIGLLLGLSLIGFFIGIKSHMIVLLLFIMVILNIIAYIKINK